MKRRGHAVLADIVHSEHVQNNQIKIKGFKTPPPPPKNQ
jgi:hypothetical protein